MSDVEPSTIKAADGEGEAIDEAYAAELREGAFAVATHGEPEAHVDALSDDTRADVEDLIARAETMRFDPDVHEELEERAVETIETTVKSAYDGADADAVTERVIERDVEATVDALREDITNIERRE